MKIENKTLKHFLFLIGLFFLCCNLNCNGKKDYGDVSDKCFLAQSKILSKESKEGLIRLIDIFEKLENEKNVNEESKIILSFVSFELYSLEKDFVRTSWYDFKKNEITKKLANYQRPYENLLNYAVENLVSASVSHKMPSQKAIEKHLPLRWLICAEAVLKNFNVKAFKSHFILEKELENIMEKIFYYAQSSLNATYLILSANEIIDLYKKSESTEEKEVFEKRLGIIAVNLEKTLAVMEKLLSEISGEDFKNLKILLQNEVLNFTNDYLYLIKKEYEKSEAKIASLSQEILQDYSKIDFQSRFDQAKRFISLSIESGDENKNISYLIRALENFIFLESLNLRKDIREDLYKVNLENLMNQFSIVLKKASNKN